MTVLQLATDTLRQLADSAVPPSTGRVELELRSDDVALLRIDHPQRRNAISLGMMVQLAEHVQTLSRWKGRVVVLCAAPGPVFCSGGDLRQLGSASPDDARAMARAMSAVLDALLDLPFVSVAAIDGLAVGGGAELVTACDYRVGGADGAIHFVHGELGVAPGWGGTQRLVNLVGRRHALRILTGARLLRMGEAERFGLVDLRADGSIVDAALSWLEPVRRLPQPAVAALKQQVVAAARGEGAEVQAERFAEVWRGPAHEQALARLARHRT